MNYDLSFDKRHATLLALCLGVIAALLVAAGFLLGLRHTDTVPAASNPALAVPALPDAKSHTRDSPAPLAASSVVSQPAPAGQLGATSVPGQTAPPASSQSPAAASTPGQGSGFTLQFGAFEERAHAEDQVKKLKEQGVIATIFTAQDRAGRTWFAVRSGSYASMTLATEAAENLRATTGEVVLVRPASVL